MKTTLVFIFGVLLMSAFVLPPGIPADYKISPDFSLVIKGTSNVHDWQSSVEELQSAILLTGSDGSLAITKCEITIPVKSIKSEKGAMMNKKTWKALNEEEYPQIKYTQSQFSAESQGSSGFTAKSAGNLSIAGVTKPVELKLTGQLLEDKTIQVSGSKKLKMTDFGIDPPTALLGTMKTGDEITIEFNVILKPN